MLFGMPGAVAAHAPEVAEKPETAETEVPLPARNPKRLEPPSPPHPRDREAPEWTAQEIQTETDRCEMMLADIGVEYEPLAPIREGVCGAPAPIELRSIGKDQKISINPPARVTCGLAATLSAWADTVVQPSAQEHLGSKVVSIRNVASYVCRNRYNAPGKRLSEHARANALDMAAFKTADGRTITISDDWALPPEKPSEEKAPDAAGGKASTDTSAAKAPETGVVHTGRDTKPPGPAENAPGAKVDEKTDEAGKENTPEAPPFRPESAFLFAIHEGACKLFGTVLGPLANEAHKDHFHYDLAGRKHRNYCE